MILIHIHYPAYDGHLNLWPRKPNINHASKFIAIPVSQLLLQYSDLKSPTWSRNRELQFAHRHVIPQMLLLFALSGFVSKADGKHVTLSEIVK